MALSRPSAEFVRTCGEPASDGPHLRSGRRDFWTTVSLSRVSAFGLDNVGPSGRRARERPTVVQKSQGRLAGRGNGMTASASPPGAFGTRLPRPLFGPSGQKGVERGWYGLQKVVLIAPACCPFWKRICGLAAGYHFLEEDLRPSEMGFALQKVVLLPRQPGCCKKWCLLPRSGLFWKHRADR